MSSFGMETAREISEEAQLLEIVMPGLQSAVCNYLNRKKISELTKSQQSDLLTHIMLLEHQYSKSFKDSLVRINKILELKSFANEPEYRNYIANVWGYNLPIPSIKEIEISNWLKYLTEYEKFSEAASKKERDILISAITNEKNVDGATIKNNFLHMLPMELACELPKIHFNSEAARLLEIIGKEAPKVVLFIMNKLNDESYYEFTKKDKLDLVRYIIQVTVYTYHWPIFFANLRTILALPNFLEIADLNTLQKDLFVFVQAFKNINEMEFLIYLMTRLANEYLINQFNNPINVEQAKKLLSKFCKEKERARGMIECYALSSYNVKLIEYLEVYQEYENIIKNLESLGIKE